MQVPSQLAGSSQNAGSPPRAGLGGGGGPRPWEQALKCDIIIKWTHIMTKTKSF